MSCCAARPHKEPKPLPPNARVQLPEPAPPPPQMPPQTQTASPPLPPPEPIPATQQEQEPLQAEVAEVVEQPHEDTVDDIDVVHHLISLAADARANHQWQVALQCYTKALEQAQDIGAPKRILIDLYSRRGQCNLETDQDEAGLPPKMTCLHTL